MYLIDTNIFLEVLLSRKNKDKCSSFLKEVQEGNIKAIMTDFSLHSLLVLMESFGKLKELKEFLIIISQFKGLMIYNTTIEDELKIIDISINSKLDFDDAVQYYTAKENSASIVSYDKDFDKLDVKRIEP